MTTPTASQTSQRPVLVVDYGAQYAQLIARRVREANVYSEVVPHTYSTEQLLAKNPAAIILSGGPSSVYAEGAPSVGADLFEAGIPVFGICYGFQAMARALGGEVAKTGISEFGRTQATIGVGGTLLADLPGITFGPAWSPDGTQIAFVNEVAPLRNLYVMDADGSDVHQVGEDGLYFVPAWQAHVG